VDCAATVWPYQTFRSMLDRDRAWERFGRRAAEMLYARKERRELSFLVRSAAERYRELLAEFPQANEVIPQHMVAAYLGIEPESLSRLKRRLTRPATPRARRKGAV